MLAKLYIKWQQPPVKPGFLWKSGSAVAITSVAVISKIILEFLSRFKGFNISTLHDVVHNRPKGQPLITVSNHVSCTDDPVIWGILPWRTILFNSSLLRWSLAGHDICFTNNFHSLICTLGKTLPVIRGNGVYQKSLDFVIEKMNTTGDWVHIFPEGKINMTNDRLRLKWGVGRLISECKTNPLVIPMWHIGMDDLLPNNRPYIPRLGQKITLLVGKPIDFSDDLAILCAAKKTSVEIRKHLTDRIQEEFVHLKDTAEKLHQQRNT